VFNNVTVETTELNQGGRLQGGFWQSLPKPLRRRLRINAEPAWEIDYVAMEVSLAYAERELNWADFFSDPYLPPGVPEDERGAYKSIFLMMLNSAHPNEALGAALKAEEATSLLGEQEVARRIRRLTDMHRPHVEIYGKRAGMERMFREAQIATAVVQDLARRGVPCLPIHDSFMVPASNLADAQRIIVSEFERQTGIAARTELEAPCIPATLTASIADPSRYSIFLKALASHEATHGRVVVTGQPLLAPPSVRAANAS
jgi:hypothetical protein